MNRKPEFKTIEEKAAFEQGRMHAIKEIRALVARDYSTRSNIDLEEQLRRLWAVADAGIRWDRR